MVQRRALTVSLTPEHAAFIAQGVESGRYLSASEVVRAGLRLLQDQEEQHQAEAQRVRSLIRGGSE